MNIIKSFGFVLLCTLACSAAVVVPAPENTKADRSDTGITQYMGYPGQGYGLGFGSPEYAAGYPLPPVAGLVPPYANGGGYLGAPQYGGGFYPPYGQYYPQPAPYPVMPQPPIYPQPPIPYPGYPIMRSGMGYSQYSAKKRMDTNGLA